MRGIGWREVQAIAKNSSEFLGKVFVNFVFFTNGWLDTAILPVELNTNFSVMGFPFFNFLSTTELSQ